MAGLERRFPLPGRHIREPRDRRGGGDPWARSRYRLPELRAFWPATHELLLWCTEWSHGWPSGPLTSQTLRHPRGGSASDHVECGRIRPL